MSDKRATAESRAWQPHNKRSSQFLYYTSLSGGLFKLRLIFPEQPELSVNYLVQRKPSSQTRKHTRWHTHTHVHKHTQTDIRAHTHARPQRERMEGGHTASLNFLFLFLFTRHSSPLPTAHTEYRKRNGTD